MMDAMNNDDAIIILYVFVMAEHLFWRISPQSTLYSLLSTLSSL